MVKTKELIARYGDPFIDRQGFIREWMIDWDIPDEINKAIPPLPNKLYCNKEFAPMLERVFSELMAKGLHTEIKTYDGCFNIRKMRNSVTPSRHSWGMAIDLNAFENPLVRVNDGFLLSMRKRYVKWTEGFLEVWRRNGFTCGADWISVLDGMHFEVKEL